jgi:hypothetical protein
MNTPRILLSILAVGGLAVVAGCGSAASSAPAAHGVGEFGGAVNAPEATVPAGSGIGASTGTASGSGGSSSRSATSAGGSSAAARP